MAGRALKVSAELAQKWKKLYASGYSISDVKAYEAAHGRTTSEGVIKREITALGVTLRTRNEAINAAIKLRYDKSQGI